MQKAKSNVMYMTDMIRCMWMARDFGGPPWRAHLVSFVVHEEDIRSDFPGFSTANLV
jgi:hypothetical protein